MKKEELLQKAGVTTLSEMQEEAYTAIKDRDGDVVVLSPTGTGKTLAYLLPLLQKIDVRQSTLQAVVVVPGRELAAQSLDVLKRMTKEVRTMTCYGGDATMNEHREIKKIQPHIIFATPGRLIDHIEKQNIDVTNIKYLVIDEFDKCLDMGFMDEMRKISQLLTAIERRILLSATDPEDIATFVAQHGTLRIDYRKEGGVVHRINIYKVASKEKDKLETLNQLLLSIGGEPSIVFVNYRESAERVYRYLVEKGFETIALQGSMAQPIRERSVYLFSNHSVNPLVSTNLASRGLDMPGVKHIIHYHLPETQDIYVHRSGRTARWDQEGTVYFILAPGEKLPDYLKKDRVETFTPTPASDQLPILPEMETFYVGRGKEHKLSKADVMGFCCKIGGLSKDDVGRIDVYTRHSLFAIKRECVSDFRNKIAGQKIKGMKTIVGLLKEQT